MDEIWIFEDKRKAFATKLCEWAYIDDNPDIITVRWWNLFKLRHGHTVDNLPFFRGEYGSCSDKLKGLLLIFDDSMKQISSTPKRGLLTFLNGILSRKRSTWYLFIAHYLLFIILLQEEMVKAIVNIPILRDAVVEKVTTFFEETENFSMMIFFYEYIDLLDNIESSYEQKMI